MKIKINAFILVILNLLFIFIAEIVKTVNTDSWVRNFLVLVVLSMVINIGFLYKKNGSVLTFTTLIYLVAMLFHLSQIYCAFVEKNDYYNIFSTFNMTICIEAFTFSYICIHIMVLFTFFKSNTDRKNIIEIDRIDKELITWFFVISYTIKIFFKIKQLISAIKGGYLNALEDVTSFTGTITIFAEVFAILFLQYCVNEKRKKILFWGIISLEVIFMLSGSRLYSLCYILMLFLSCRDSILESYHKTNNRIKKRTSYFKLLFLVFIGVSLIEIIRFGRENANIAIMSIDAFFRKYDLFYEFFEEIGGTQRDMVVALSSCDRLQFLHGKSYLLAIITLVPNIGGVYNELLNNFKFVYQLNEISFWNYGGSFVCEAYMNFGKMAIFLFPVIGLVVGKLNKLFENRTHYSVTLQIFIVTLCYVFFSWTRGYFFNVVRAPFYFTIIYFMARKVIKR